MTRISAIILLLATLIPAAGKTETPALPVKILDLAVKSIEGNRMTVQVAYHQLKEKYSYAQGQTTDFVTFLILDAAGNTLEQQNVIFPENRPKDDLGNPVIYNSQVLLPAPEGMSRVEIRFKNERLSSAGVPANADACTAPYLKIKENTTRQFDAKGDYLRFDVSASLPGWEIQHPGWCSIADRTTVHFTLKAEANRTGSERKGTVSISSCKMKSEIEVSQQSEAVSNGKALINKVKINKNAVSGSQKGIEVRIKADLTNMKGRTALFKAILMGSGQILATGTASCIPERDYGSTKQRIFIPFNDFDDEARRRKQYWVNIVVFDENASSTEPPSIGRMDFNYIK